MAGNFEIRRIDVIKSCDAKTPTLLTASYKGWWRLPFLYTSLSLQPVRDGFLLPPMPGKVRLHQTFPQGKGPQFRVKGCTKVVHFKVFEGLRQRNLASVSVTDLRVRCAGGRLGVLAFDFEEGGKLDTAYLQVAQVVTTAARMPLPAHFLHCTAPARPCTPASASGSSSLTQQLLAASY